MLKTEEKKTKARIATIYLHVKRMIKTKLLQMIIGVIFSQINGAVPLNGRGHSFKTKGSFHLKERPN